jgi:hypothetical protein
MAATHDLPAAPQAVRCSYHPDVETMLRCSRCGKPICPRCAIRTPVGMRCPECAGVAAQVGPLGIERLTRGIGYGLAVAVPVGVLWGLAPAWGFYLGLVLGFAAAEMVARAVPGRRGPDLQLVAIGVVVVALVISRWVIARQAGADLFALDFGSGRVQRGLWLRPLPDLLFAGLPMVIAWYRFR